MPTAMEAWRAKVGTSTTYLEVVDGSASGKERNAGKEVGKEEGWKPHWPHYLSEKPHTPRAAHASSPKVRSSGVIDQPSTQSASPPVRQAIKPSNPGSDAQVVVSHLKD
ncbi:hypothetical protein VCV18_001069 [Metarhizium anisopliae]